MNDLICEDFSVDNNLVTKFNDESVDIEKIILDKENAKKISREEGIYYTLTSDAILEVNKKKYDDLENVFSNIIKEYLTLYKVKKEDPIFVVGLGNSSVTPDSLGPKVIEMINVTSHLFKLNMNEDNMQNVYALSPGVMSQTGLETADIVCNLVSNLKPKLVIVIDALASKSLTRINRTIQINNTSISPGAGIGNFRKKFSYETLGCPLVAIGVPTVVDVKSIFIDLLKDNNINLDDVIPFATEYDTIHFMVTPKEIDENILDMSNIISKGLNKAFHNLEF